MDECEKHVIRLEDVVGHLQRVHKVEWTEEMKDRSVCHDWAFYYVQDTGFNLDSSAALLPISNTRKRKLDIEDLRAMTDTLASELYWSEAKYNCPVCNAIVAPSGTDTTTERRRVAFKHLVTHLQDRQHYPYKCPITTCQAMYTACAVHLVKYHVETSHKLEWTETLKTQCVNHDMSYYSMNSDENKDAKPPSPLPETAVSERADKVIIENVEELHSETQSPDIHSNTEVPSLTLAKLREHLQHTESTSCPTDKTYHCPNCHEVVETPRRQDRKKVVLTHLLAHLPDHRLYPFKCPISTCQHSAAQIEFIKNHMLTTHHSDWTEEMSALIVQHEMDFYYGTSVVEKAATMVRTFPKESATKDDVEKLLDAVISNIEDERLIAALRESTGLRRDFTEFERHFMDYLATLMNQRRVTSIREAYYEMQIFKQTSYESFKSTVSNLCLKLGVSRDILPIIAAPKAYALGHIEIRTTDGSTIRFDQSLVPIEERFADVTHVHCLHSARTKALILVEQHCTLDKLRRSSFLQEFPNVIFVATCGYPPDACKRFCNVVADQLQLPIYVVTDCDPHGLQIAQNLICGNSKERNQVRNGNLRLLNAEWRGLKSSDVVNHSRCVRLKRGQAKLLSNIIERALKHGHVDMAREGERILKDNLTFPLQSLEIDEWKQFFQRILTDATECNPPQVTYASYYLGTNEVFRTTDVKTPRFVDNWENKSKKPRIEDSFSSDDILYFSSPRLLLEL